MSAFKVVVSTKDEKDVVVGDLTYIEFFHQVKTGEEIIYQDFLDLKENFYSDDIYIEFSEDPNDFFITIKDGVLVKDEMNLDQDLINRFSTSDFNVKLIYEDMVIEVINIISQKQISTINKMVVAWDLDGTLIDSSHRISFKEDGSFDLDYWIENCTHEQIMKDKLLPLADIYFEYKNTGFTQICVTARNMSDADFEFLKKHGLEFDIILHRNNSNELDEVLKTKKVKDFFEKNRKIPFQAYDDKQENLEIFDKFGFRTFQAAYLNKVLDCNSIEEIEFKPKDF